MITHDNVQSTAALDDSALTLRLTTLLGDERKHLVDFLRHLAEFDSRKVYLRLGYSSLFVYCRDGLKLAKASAYRRYTVARLLSRFPVIAGFLEDGRLNLTRVAKLDDVLTIENHLDVLARASLGSEEDVDVLVATLKPKPDATDSIRKAPARTVIAAPKVTESPPTAQTSVPTARIGSAVEPLLSSMVEGATACEQPTAPRDMPPTPAPEAERRPGSVESLLSGSAAEPRADRPRRMEVEATSATAFCVRMRVGPEFLEEFEAVKAALSHKFPDGNFEDILRECFRVTLEAVDRRRAARTTRCGTNAATEAAPPPVAPKAANPPETKAEGAERSRYIPAAVRRAVWQRDAGRCAFVSADGKRCDARHQVEFHHLKAFASGGPSTEDNVSLRCRAHNAYEAELDFGADFMEAKVRMHGRRSKAAQAVPLWNSNEAEMNSAADSGSGPDPAKLH